LFQNLDDYVSKIAEINPEEINGYPSGIYLIATHALRRNLKEIRPKAVITSAETLYEEQREVMEQAFACKVADQYGAPTWARNIVDVTAHVLFAAQQERQAGEFSSGTYHLCASGKTTWHGFSSAIIERAKQLSTAGSIKTERVLPIATDDYPLPASRPENSQLDSSSLTARFGIIMPEWHHAMKLCIDEVLDAQ